jgi:integrase
MATGITKRHSRGCPSRDGGRCRCNAGWEASVYSKRDGKKIRKVFAREAEAKSWRADALYALARGGLRAPKPTTVREAWEEWYEGAGAGTVRNKSGDRYKPSSLRDYERNMRLRVLPELGGVRLTDVRRPDLQEFADGLLATGLDPSTIRTTFLPLRAIYRRAVARGEVAVNPCTGLELPAVRGRRERFASPEEAEALIAAVSEGDRAIWATAMYAGLRRGELRALRVQALDLAAGVIRVERGYDAVEGEIELKSGAGRRKVPIPAVLRDYLTEDLARTGRTDADRCFGTTGIRPVDGRKLQARADKAWREAGLDRITPHECRHTFASLMIAAGVNAKALQTFMGHSNITTTLDTYGHLMPGSEDEAAGLLDAYLAAQRERAEDAARAAGAAATGALTGAPVAHDA